MNSDIQKVIDEASAWLDIDGVDGVGEGSKDGKVCVVVGCSCPPDNLKGKIPESFMGYPVVIESWGIISAQADD